MLALMLAKGSEVVRVEVVRVLVVVAEAEVVSTPHQRSN